MVKHQIEIIDTNPWDEIFDAGTPLDLQETYEKFNEFVELLKQHNVQKVLDVACGNGRHTTALAKQGFDTFGFDISENAVNLTRHRSLIEGVATQIQSANMFKTYPYCNEYFDAVLAIQAIYHGTQDNFTSAIKEICRVLKKDGILILTTSNDKERSTMGSDEAKFVQVDTQTYIPVVGREKGLLHFYPNKDQLASILSPFFSKVEIEEDEKNKYYIARCYQ